MHKMWNISTQIWYRGPWDPGTKHFQMRVMGTNIGLHINLGPGSMTLKIIDKGPQCTTTGGTALKEVNDFKYLGKWVNSTEQVLKVRKALAWRALNDMASAWNSNLPR